jgi:hypothetical protein
MDEASLDRLCGLIARLRQQHTALGATLDEIEACLAGRPPEPATAERSQGAVERTSELPRFLPADAGPAACFRGDLGERR